MVNEHENKTKKKMDNLNISIWSNFIENETEDFFNTRCLNL